ncbi:MAG: hypothetical protein K6T16_00440 [Candidatus Pacearchaeota archaeon]|nr:hypothetical protein [Candidatus Pacearchaeota archaeon]
MVEGYYGGFGWTSLYGVLQQWESFGVFTVLFPLVLIFSVVFAILEKINIFNNRGVNLLVALVIGFFTVSNPYVGGFFMYFFSNIGLAVAIIIALIVLIGVAIQPEDKTWKNIFLVVGLALFLIVLGRSGAFKVLFGEAFGYWLQANSAVVVLMFIVVLMIVAVMMGFKKAGGTIGKIVPTGS